MMSGEVIRRRDALGWHDVAAGLSFDVGLMWLRHFGLGPQEALSVGDAFTRGVDTPRTGANDPRVSKIVRGLVEIEVPRLGDRDWTRMRRRWSEVIYSWGVLVCQLPSEYDLADLRLLNAASVEYIGIVTPFRERAIIADDDNGSDSAAARAAGAVHLLVANHALADYALRVRRYLGAERLSDFERWAAAAIASQDVVPVPREEDWSGHQSSSPTRAPYGPTTP